jgi:hypothetical protein
LDKEKDLRVLKYHLLLLTKDKRFICLLRNKNLEILYMLGYEQVFGQWSMYQVTKLIEYDEEA